ncbi:MAG: NAD-dependent epimerase/dehydratase family protein [Woeseiaceae bacterium]|nr:NAD-dependent epimerase/dehydratase family protein [Woeseiaceae bacterium]
MKVLITGGTGFIGSRLALRCRELGWQVTVLGREDAGQPEVENRVFLESNGIEIIAGSVTDRERMFEISRGMQVVFHLAAAQHEMNIPDEHFRAVNVEGTRNMLDASVESKVGRFIHGSTIGVYDRDDANSVDELTKLRPSNIYGITKAEGEKVVKTYFSRLPCVIVRISETYGPGDRRLLKLFRAINKGVFFMIGNGENVHQLVFVDDLVDGLISAADCPAAPGEVLLLAGQDQSTSNEMVEAVANALDVRAKFWRAPLWPFMFLATILEYSLRPLGLQPPLHRRRMDFFTKSFRISTRKASEILGFSARTNFAAGARKTAVWYKDNGLL